MKTNKNLNAPCRIAVIGVSCNYPGAKSPVELWENILAKRRQFREMPDVRLPNKDYYDPDPSVLNKTYQNKAAVIDGFEFDWAGHKIPKQTFECTDIVHWLALDTALKAVADTRFNKDTLPREKTGVILGNTLTGEFTRSNQMLLRWPFVKRALMASARSRGMDMIAGELAETMEAYYKSVFAEVTEDTLAGGLANTIAGRVCNYLDLHGGGYIVDGACSSSLIAVVTACNMLELGQMDMAIAGGVDVSLDTFELIGFAKTGALTPDEMRVYDKNGRGFLPGEGCGMIVLKRLEDAVRDKDYIYATIEGWGISSDGKGGITAPSVAGQSRALIRAYEKAGLNPSVLDFIEGHGTGTTVGDRVELEAIAGALSHFGATSERTCGVTSFKSIVGHTKAAAGIGAFIKAVIAVNRRIVPPTAGLKELNPVFYDKAKNIYPVIKGEIKDPASEMHAGISAMGFGGINSHVIVKSADAPSSKLRPETDEEKLLSSSRSHELFLFSGNTPDELADNIVQCIKNASGISYSEMADLSAFQNRNNNISHVYRAALVADTPFELTSKLNKTLDLVKKHGCRSYITEDNDTVAVGCKKDSFKIGAVFPGQGSQKLNMASRIAARHGSHRSLVDKAQAVLKAHYAEGVLEAIEKELNKSSGPDQVKEWMNKIKSTDIAQPAITFASLLWYEYLKDFGIGISCVTGHSLGELMAFYAAGLMDMETLLSFSVFRGKSMAGSGSGKMVSVQCSLPEAKKLVDKAEGYSTIANINSPSQVVISGDASAIDHIFRMAQNEKISATILPVSAAFHSTLVSETAHAVRNLEALKFKGEKNGIELISCMDGRPVNEGTDLNEYFSKQVTSQVNFVEAIGTMAKKCDVIIEAGPGRVLSGLIPSINEKLKAFSVEVSGDDDQSLLIMLANVFVNGCPVNPEMLYENRLIRSFVPAAKRTFIINPLEREYRVSGIDEGTGLLTENLNGDGNFKNYMADRGDFIRAMIDTDYRYYKNTSASLSTTGNISTQLSVTGRSTSTSLSVNGVNTSTPLSVTDGKDGKTVLYEVLQSMTGFSPEIFSGDMKLLDDFNLDSIKSATLLSTVAKKLGITGKLNIQQLSNGSISSIISAIESNIDRSSETGQSSADQYEIIRKEVFEQLAHKTGFPAEALRPDLRLLDDLNLDSIKSGSIIAGLTKKFGITGRVSPASLANAKITELVDALAAHLTGVKPSKSIPEQKKKIDWVNAYTRVQVKKEPGNKENGPLPAKLVIACSGEDKNLALFLESRLKHEFGQIIVADFANLQASASTEDACLLVLVPMLEVNQKNTERMISFLTEINRATKYQTIAFFERSGNELLSLASAVASVHHERPDKKYRVIRFEKDASHEALPGILSTEITTADPFDAVFYNGHCERFEEQYKLVDGDTIHSGIRLTTSDVVLATGGAKGITSQCVLELARKYRHKTALVGSSPLNSEIKALMETYQKEDLPVMYYSCDITEPASVKNMITAIRAELGEVTAVVHGAGKNIPRRAETISADEAISEISPKLSGAMVLCDALKDSPARIFIALTSIIGITGMKGNSMYAFANENLNLYLRKKSKELHFISRTYAYSIWDEIGMGARMGSNEVLSALGIGSIRPQKGVEQFLKWIDSDPGDQQVVISSAMGMLDTWKLYRGNFPSANRYTGEVRTFEPGRSLITRVKLNGTDDPYLKDHNYNDTLLFPTVFGLEAMTQVSCALLGISDPYKIIFEDLMLTQPIIVPPDGETVIQIEAEFIDETERRVRAGIKVEYTNFGEYHFSSEISFPREKEEITVSQPVNGHPLKICPQTDLYSWLLFQGPKFRLIRNVYGLSAEDVSFTTNPPQVNGQQMILGSAYLRDVLLQSVQIFLTGKKYLPVFVKRWTLFKAGNHFEEGTVNSRLREMRHDSAVCDVEFIVNSQLAEKIEGYEVKAVGSTPDYPHPEVIADLPAMYRKALTGEFEKYSRFCSQPVYVSIYKHHEEFNRLNASQRLMLEQEAFEAMHGPDHSLRNSKIARAENGKPFIEGSDLGISISHSGTLLLLTAGKYEQGCDIEFITKRSAEEWNDLFENRYAEILDELVKIDHDKDMAATRIWCAREALIKSNGTLPLVMTVEKVHDRGVILKVGSRDQGNYRILTFPVNVLPNNPVMTAILIDYNKDAGDDIPASTISSVFRESDMCFVHNFISTFKDCRGFYGKSSFSVIPEWMGTLRELVLAPLGQLLLRDLGSGDFGMVTNASAIRMLNETDSLSEITGKLRITEKSDPDNSLIDLSFDFFKNVPDGKPVKLAECSLSTTWVAIESRGVVKKSPLPGYFKAFIQEHTCRTVTVGQLSNNGFPSLNNLGKILFEEKNRISHTILLHEHDFTTGMYDGNSVGNLYYSNYYRWQAEMIEQYLFGIIPGILKANGREGEFITVESSVQHLQEAMPFEVIHVNMYLDRVCENGFKLHFDYFSKDAHVKRKLAHGNNTVIFCKRSNSESLPLACAIPESAFGQVMNRIQV